MSPTNIFDAYRSLQRRVQARLDGDQLPPIIDSEETLVDILADAQLYLTAGTQMMARGNNKSAAKIFRKGIETLDENPVPKDETGEDIALELYSKWAETEILNTNFLQSLELAESLITRAKSKDDLAEAYELKIRTLMFMGRLQEAENLVLYLSEELGIPITSEKPPEFSPQDLADLPEVQEPWKESLIRCHKALGEITFITCKFELCLSSVLTAMRFCLEHGRSSLLYQCLMDYALMLCCHFGEVEKGYQFGKFALESLAERDKLSKPGCRCAFFGMISNWVLPIRDLIEPLEETFSIGARVGDFMMASCSVLAALDDRRFIGFNLAELRSLYEQWESKFRQLNLEYPLTYASIAHQLILDLQGERTRVFDRSGLSMLIESQQYTPVFLACICETMRAYLLGNPLDALTIIQEFKKYEKAAFGYIINAELNLYNSLSLIACLTEENEVAYMQKIAANQKIAEGWARNAEGNFNHGYLLVEAELDRLDGKIEEAKVNYDRAILYARANGFIQIAAIANELAGKLYLSIGEQENGISCLSNAYQLYIDWGAIAVAERLAIEFPWLCKNSISIDSSNCIVEGETNSISIEKWIAQVFVNRFGLTRLNGCRVSFLRCSETLIIEFQDGDQLDQVWRDWGDDLAKVAQSVGCSDEELIQIQKLKLHSPQSNCKPLSYKPFSIKQYPEV